MQEDQDNDLVNPQLLKPFRLSSTVKLSASMQWYLHCLQGGPQVAEECSIVMSQSDEYR